MVTGEAGSMRKPLAAVLAATLVLGLASCGSTAAHEPIRLTIATFTDFGYEELLTEYKFLHPEIEVVHRRVAQGGPYHEDMLAKLTAGTGLADIQALEEGHMSTFIDKADKFNDLNEIGPGDVQPSRWLQWKYEGGKSKDGKLIGYGTDIGPLAMCYRTDLFRNAGLPTDPEQVKTLFATWDSYFAAGDRYLKGAGGKAWFDSSAQIFNSMVNQLDTGYVNRDDSLAIEGNPRFRQSWDKVTAAAKRGQTAKLTAFSDEWIAGLHQGTFATKTCPSWMLGVIKDNAGPENAGKWAVSDAFPEGSGNWGGSYLTVPKQSSHPREAAALAAWLTAPEQQLTAFKTTGNFPSQVAAYDSPDLSSATATSAYFGGIQIGELFARQARKVTHAQYKGPRDGQIQENVITPALTAVEGGLSAQEGWARAVADAKQLWR
jgi:cellobiose transport system substrate-binding protein